LQSRARKCIFLGYKSGFKGSVLFDLDSREIFISRNVVFHELILPYSSSSSPTTNWQYFSPSSTHSSMFDDSDISLSSPSPITPPTPTTSPVFITPPSPPIHPPIRASTRNKVTPAYL